MSSSKILSVLKEAEQTTMDFQCARELADIIDKIERGKKLSKDDKEVISEYYDGRSRDQQVPIIQEEKRETSNFCG